MIETTGRCIGAAAVALALGAAVYAATGCSSRKSAAPGGCTQTDALTIVFSPMYSAVIPGDPTHAFQLPVIVTNPNVGTVTWSASDPTAVSIQADATTGGALLTMLNTASNPGAPVTITATAGSACGSATLNITTFTTADWSAGEQRYNDRVGPDGGARAACTDCHSPTATEGAGFDDVAHTPEQTGGFSDDDLLNIVQHGEVADGGYFDPSIVSYKAWQAFHQWNLTSDEQTGIVVYLRSLAPSAQGGKASFGGVGAPDGG